MVIGLLFKRKGENKMNIMFILKTFEMGGVEIVTTFLANKFVDEGNSVSVFAFADAEHSIIDKLDKRVKTCTLRKLACNAENIDAMRAVMIEDKVQVVINQWGLPFVPLKTALRAAKGLDVKFISVYHNTPDMNGRLQKIDNQLSLATSPLKKAGLRLLRSIFKEITAYGLRWNYRHSNRYMVLSPSFVQKFKDYACIRDGKKLVVQTNPVTIDCEKFEYSLGMKQKEIIFVGRLEFYQKKVNRVIDTWAMLEERFPEWKLTIVGDGPDRINVEKLACKKNLKRISFEGFQNPLKFYKRASVLVLTSEYEGFPLVLAEAMSFGIIPVVYGSYSAVYDILKDGINGRIVKPLAKKFVTKNMAEAVASVLKDTDYREKMAYEAIKTSKEYSVEVIYKQWIKVMRELI